MQAYDLRQALGDRLVRLKQVDDSTPSARTLMRRAKLVVVDYLSTAYLEALMLNVPTVFFWNRDTYYLEDAHRDFFDLLISARICHTDPLEAARFVDAVKDEPLQWWRAEAVQAARQRFLRENMGAPETMINHLVRHSSKRSTDLALASCP
jgi:putative transferase (TIGR04331 family)